MLGFSKSVCPTLNGASGSAASEVPIWMSRLFCSGTEKYLDHCQFSGWGQEAHNCASHSDDAGVVCENGMYR